MTQTTDTAVVPGYRTGTWDLDPVHSEVGFSVRHMMVSKVRGRFATVAAELVTAEDPFASAVTATIDLASIDTGNEQRDAHLRSSDFFETDTQTQLTFRSTGVRADGDDFVLDGELTLHGVTRPVSLDLEVNGFGPDAFGGTRAGFSARGQINRSDFGITYNAPIEAGGVVIGDTVRVEIEAEFVLRQS